MVTECSDAAIDLAFLIDSSGSICENDPTFSNGRCNNWVLMIDFVYNLVNGLSIGSNRAKVAAVLFSTDAETMFTLDEYEQILFLL